MTSHKKGTASGEGAASRWTTPRLCTCAPSPGGTAKPDQMQQTSKGSLCGGEAREGGGDGAGANEQQASEHLTHAQKHLKAAQSRSVRAEASTLYEPT